MSVGPCPVGLHGTHGPPPTTVTDRSRGGTVGGVVRLRRHLWRIALVATIPPLAAGCVEPLADPGPAPAAPDSPAEPSARLERDLREQMAAHREMVEADLIARGMNPAEAALAATAPQD